MDTLCSAGRERSGKGKAGLAQAESDAKRATVISQSAANRRFQSGLSHCENLNVTLIEYFRYMCLGRCATWCVADNAVRQSLRLQKKAAAKDQGTADLS